MICRVEVKERITIPSMSSMMIPVEIHGVDHLTKLGYVEGKTEISKPVHAVPGIIDTKENHSSSQRC